MGLFGRSRRPKEWPAFPNLGYSWRMPLTAACWKLAWWLLKHGPAIRWMTREGQARVIAEALGAYRPAMAPGLKVGPQNLTGSNSYTVWREADV